MSNVTYLLKFHTEHFDNLTSQNAFAINNEVAKTNTVLSLLRNVPYQ